MTYKARRFTDSCAEDFEGLESGREVHVHGALFGTCVYRSCMRGRSANRRSMPSTTPLSSTHSSTMTHLSPAPHLQYNQPGSTPSFVLSQVRSLRLGVWYARRGRRRSIYVLVNDSLLSTLHHSLPALEERTDSSRNI